MHKRAELWFAAGGFFVALLLGVPPIVALLRDARSGSAAVYILSAVALALISAFLYWQYKTPPWTVQCAKYRLEILDEMGSKASFRKTSTLRSNTFHPNERYIHRRLGGDGSFVHEVDPKMKVIDVRTSLGETEIEVEFPFPLHFWGEESHWIELTYTDTFPTDRESIRIDLDEPVHSLETQIVFPAARRPLDWGAYYRSSGKKYELPKPELDSPLVLTWKFHRWFPTLRRGRYDLWWRW